MIGFAAESSDLIENAGKKLAKKNLDMIIANDISQRDAGFEVNTNQVVIIGRGFQNQLPLITKEETAHKIIDILVENYFRMV